MKQLEEEDNKERRKMMMAELTPGDERSSPSYGNDSVYKYLKSLPKGNDTQNPPTISMSGAAAHPSLVHKPSRQAEVSVGRKDHLQQSMPTAHTINMKRSPVEGSNSLHSRPWKAVGGNSTLADVGGAIQQPNKVRVPSPYRKDSRQAVCKEKTVAGRIQAQRSRFHLQPKLAVSRHRKNPDKKLGDAPKGCSKTAVKEHRDSLSDSCSNTSLSTIASAASNTGSVSDDLASCPRSEADLAEEEEIGMEHATLADCMRALSNEVSDGDDMMSLATHSSSVSPASSGNTVHVSTLNDHHEPEAGTRAVGAVHTTHAKPGPNGSSRNTLRTSDANVPIHTQRRENLQVKPQIGSTKAAKVVKPAGGVARIHPVSSSPTVEKNLYRNTQTGGRGGAAVSKSAGPGMTLNSISHTGKHRGGIRLRVEQGTPQVTSPGLVHGKLRGNETGQVHLAMHIGLCQSSSPLHSTSSVAFQGLSLQSRALEFIAEITTEILQRETTSEKYVHNTFSSTFLCGRVFRTSPRASPR